jgi:hypothetical protein
MVAAFVLLPFTEIPVREVRTVALLSIALPPLLTALIVIPGLEASAPEISCPLPDGLYTA